MNEPSNELVLVRHEDGVLVSGEPEEVHAFVDELTRLGGSGTTAAGLADAAAVGASAGAFLVASCDYVRFTDRAAALLQEHGAVPSGDGAFWSFVRDKAGFAGNLDWKQVDIGPERALSLQAAAVGLALRTAIKQVEAAVERVEGKVDRVAKLVQAERLGTAVGNHRTLTAIVERVRAEGTISTTDWSSVASLGPAIVEDIEALRAYARSELSEAKGGWRTRGRADDAVELLEHDLVVESVGLLVIAEHNLSLWQELRVANVRAHEPQHLASALDDAHAALDAQRAHDRQLLDEFGSVVVALTTPARHDGLAPLQSQRLTKASERLDDLASWFAEQRTLDFVPLERDSRPGWKESIGHVAGRVGETASGVLSRIRRRSEGPDDPPELPSGS